jgi:hypothetical protein
VESKLEPIPILEVPAFVVDNPYFVEHTFVDLDLHKIVVVVHITSIVVNTTIGFVSFINH